MLASARRSSLGRALVHHPAALAVALVVVLGAGAGCGQLDASKAMSRAEPAAVSAAAPAGGLPSATGGATLPEASPRALRITVETNVVVKDIDAATSAVRAMTTASGGYVGEARTQGGSDSRSSYFELHVPAAKLGELRAAVGRLGEVASDSEKAEDVTEQRADLGARLHNARMQEKRLLDLLSDKTGALADVVAVEKEIAAVRENVERMEAQQRLLEGQIAFATVKLSLSTRYVAVATTPGARIAEAVHDGFSNAGGFLVGLAVFLASAGPTMLILAAIGYAMYCAVRAVARRRRARLVGAA